MTAGLANALHYPRLHNIWARGMLPIIVNLLTAIGPRIGPDVVRFLGFFGRQVEGLVDSWGQRGNPVTLAAVRETGRLVGLLEILRAWGVDIPAPKGQGKIGSGGGSMDLDIVTIRPQSPFTAFDVFGGPQFVDVTLGVRFDKSTVLEGVEYLLNHRNYLASLVVPTTQEEGEENVVPVEKAAGVGCADNKAAAAAAATVGGVSKLVEKVIKEMDVLRRLLTVVLGEEDEGEKA